MDFGEALALSIFVMIFETFYEDEKMRELCVHIIFTLI